MSRVSTLRMVGRVMRHLMMKSSKVSLKWIRLSTNCVNNMSLESK
jgi:hypothetical protein